MSDPSDAYMLALKADETALAAEIARLTAAGEHVPTLLVLEHADVQFEIAARS